MAFTAQTLTSGCMSGLCVSKGSVCQLSTHKVALPLTSNGHASPFLAGAQRTSWLGELSGLSVAGGRSIARSTYRHAGVQAALKEDEYQVTLEKPIGLNFYRGSDGGTYIDKIQPGGNADKSGLFEVGDKVLETSAVFGTEMWPAGEFGRAMYTIKTRIGNVAFKMQKQYGKRIGEEPAENLSELRKAQSIGEGVRELQYKNYLKKVEDKQQRAEKMEEGLKLYRSGQYEDALVEFETVLGLRPTDREAAVASYNVACCYSKLNQVDAGLDALDKAMEAGFDEYKTVRLDPDLDNLRRSDKFTPLVNKYDEPFINENAVKALKNVFGGFFGSK